MAKRGAKPAVAKKRASSPRKKVRQVSWLDKLLRTLPFSEEDIQRAFTWLVLVVLLVIGIAVARYTGLTDAAYQQYAQLAAKAGFEVKRVEITGMQRVDQLKVYDIVLAEKDRAMPLVDVDKIRDDLMQYGWIKDVHVSRRLPDTLVVEIIERKPAALWSHDDKFALIDDQGIVLEASSPAKAGDLPLLAGTDANKHAVELAELLDKANSLKSQVVAASWIGNRRWDLKFKTGEVLSLPEGDKESAQALLNFARMDGVNRLLGRDLIHFDMRDPSRLYVRKAPKAAKEQPGASKTTANSVSGVDA